MTYDGNILGDVSSDSEDIFNDRITDKLDQFNKSEAMKVSAVDQLTSPDHGGLLTNDQGTTATKASIMNESAATVQTTMIDTCMNGSATKAFDSGVH